MGEAGEEGWVAGKERRGKLLVGGGERRYGEVVEREGWGDAWEIFPVIWLCFGFVVSLLGLLVLLGSSKENKSGEEVSFGLGGF